MRQVVVLALAFALVTLACGGSTERLAPTATKQPRVSATPTSGAASYSNPAFQIELRYPVSWVPDPLSLFDACEDGLAESYSNPRGRQYGYFQISAAGAPLLDLDQLANTEVSHKHKPYGDNPRILSLAVDGREARLILPDETSPPPDEAFRAALIVPYSVPIVLRKPPPGEPADSYNYLEVGAHKDFIRSIADSLELREPVLPAGTVSFCGCPTPPPSP